MRRDIKNSSSTAAKHPHTVCRLCVKYSRSLNLHFILHICCVLLLPLSLILSCSRCVSSAATVCLRWWNGEMGIRVVVDAFFHSIPSTLSPSHRMGSNRIFFLSLHSTTKRQYYFPPPFSVDLYTTFRTKRGENERIFRFVRKSKE